MYNYNSGYSGFSMSNRAVEAYEQGEKPISKWTKTAFFEELNENLKDYNISAEKINALKSLKVSVLKERFLKNSSWHHTSNYFNNTNFYSINYSKIEEMTAEGIKALKNQKPEKKESSEPEKKKGKIFYLEWSGSRKHPKATERVLEDVYILEKGCFYYVFDEKNKEILKKKIGSNGTSVQYY
jgi:hypothetical protein